MIFLLNLHGVGHHSIEVPDSALARAMAGFLRKASLIADPKYLIVDGAVGLLEYLLLHLVLGRKRAGMSAADLYLLTALAGDGSSVVFT